MRAKLYIWMLGIALLGWWTSMSAHTRLTAEEYHFIYLSGELGSSSLLHSADVAKPGVGVAPALGFGYRMYYNGFVFELGASGQFAYYTQRIADASLPLRMKDTEGDIFTLHAHVRESKDRMSAFNAQIPLLLGYEHQMFYFLAGAQMMFNAWASASTSSLLTTTAEYDQFIGELFDMPNHSLVTDQEIAKRNVPIRMNLNVMAHLEMGVRLDEFYRTSGFHKQRKKIRYYLAAFADYGVLNSHQNVDGAKPILYYEQKENEELKFYVNPSMSCQEMNGVQVHPFTIGVKFTLLFEMPHMDKSKIYNATGNENYHVIRGNAQAIDD